MAKNGLGNVEWYKSHNNPPIPCGGCKIASSTYIVMKIALKSYNIE
jgi:hypothetical protein